MVSGTKRRFGRTSQSPGDSAGRACNLVLTQIVHCKGKGSANLKGGDGGGGGGGGGDAVSAGSKKRGVGESKVPSGNLSAANGEGGGSVKPAAVGLDAGTKKKSRSHAQHRGSRFKKRRHEPCPPITIPPSDGKRQVRSQPCQGKRTEAKVGDGCGVGAEGDAHRGALVDVSGVQERGHGQHGPSVTMGGKRGREASATTHCDEPGAGPAPRDAAKPACDQVKIPGEAAEALGIQGAGQGGPGEEECIKWRLPPADEDLRIFKAPRGRDGAAKQGEGEGEGSIIAGGIGASSTLLRSNAMGSEFKVAARPKSGMGRASSGRQQKDAEGTVAAFDDAASVSVVSVSTQTIPVAVFDTAGSTIASEAAQVREAHEKRIKQMQLQSSIKLDELSAASMLEMEAALEKQRGELEEVHAGQVRSLTSQSLGITADLEARIQDLHKKLERKGASDKECQRMKQSEKHAVARAEGVNSRLEAILSLLPPSNHHG